MYKKIIVKLLSIIQYSNNAYYNVTRLIYNILVLLVSFPVLYYIIII